MPRNLTVQLDGIPRKTLAMGSESLRKPLADDPMKRAIGGAIERALSLAGLTKQAAAYAMGYGENQAPLSRWISGVETPQFARLFSVEKLRSPLVVALAELAGDVDVQTVITVRRRA